jgi:hypothetical protein
MLKTKADYERAFAVVTRVVHEWDPYGLIEVGAPSDEFDPEVRDIIPRLAEIRSPLDASELLSEVFGRWFGPEDFPLSSCMEAGQALYLSLRKEEFVP